VLARQPDDRLETSNALRVRRVFKAGAGYRWPGSLLFGVSIRPPAAAGGSILLIPPNCGQPSLPLLADARSAVRPSDRPAVGVIAPHAGYIYSGPTAAAVFAQVTIPGLVIILAPNHTGISDAEGGVSLWEAGAFRTPLGDVPIEAELAQALLRDLRGVVSVDHEAQSRRACGRSRAPVSPDAPVRCAHRAVGAGVGFVGAGAAARRHTGPARPRAAEPVLLLASSDLNHYEPAAVSEAKDARALEAARVGRGELLARCKRERISMCGGGRRPPSSPPPGRWARPEPTW